MNPYYEEHEPDLDRLRRDPRGSRRHDYDQDPYGERRRDSRTQPTAMALPHAHHELTLSAGAILGLFFGLVVLCGLFFGLGYSMHRHESEAVASEGSPTTATAANFGAFKPAAGLPAGAGATAHTPTLLAGAIAKVTPKVAEAATDTVSPAAPIVRVAPAAVTALPAAGTVMVQIAAISIPHRQDADLLLNALKAKGYAAFARQDTDNLIHVQVGPFPTRAAAEAARQRLQTDGYSPYIK